MNHVKRLLALLLTLSALAALLAVPALAISAPKKQTVIIMRRNESVRICLYDMKEGQSIKKGSIKSSNKSVLAPTGLSYSLDWEESLKGKSSDVNKSCYITLKAKKPGTAKISYTVGKRTFTTTVTIKKYQNPVKRFQITSYRSGKNLASAFDRNTSAEGLLSANLKKRGNIVVEAAPGWKVRSIDFSNDKTGEGRAFTYSYKGMQKAVLPIPEIMKKYFPYSISFMLYNAKLDEFTTLYYTLDGDY